MYLDRHMLELQERNKISIISEDDERFCEKCGCRCDLILGNSYFDFYTGDRITIVKFQCPEYRKYIRSNGHSVVIGERSFRVGELRQFAVVKRRKV